MKNKLTLIVCLAALVFGCRNTNKNQKTTQQVQFETQQDTIALKAKATEEAYKKMTTEQLLPQLETDALKGEETFNSSAFREIITRKDAAQSIYGSIKDTSRKEFFKLMALKKIDNNLYNVVTPDTAIAILTDALDKSVTFNVWGMPDHYWESSAKAIIDFGKPAKPYLIKILTNKRAAPVWGSEEAMEYQKYKYRVCDYAAICGAVPAR